MNKLRQQAIELKYEGMTYEEISTTLTGKLSINTLKSYFAVKGQLYDSYLEYESIQNKIRQMESGTMLQKKSSRAAQIIIDAMEKAVEDGDNDKAVKYAKDVLNLATSASERESQIKNSAYPGSDNLGELVDRMSRNF